MAAGNFSRGDKTRGWENFLDSVREGGEGREGGCRGYGWVLVTGFGRLGLEFWGERWKGEGRDGRCSLCNLG